jgi:hypothetical protein
MTTSVAGQLIDFLGTYYDTTKFNAAANPPIDNEKNAQRTIDAIVKLKITDDAYASIINTNDLDNSSKINVINTTLRNAITKNNPDMSINKYRGVLSVLEDTSGQPGQKVSEVKQIVYVNSQDSRFSYIFDGTVVYGDDDARIEAIKTAAYNALNPV